MTRTEFINEFHEKLLPALEKVFDDLSAKNDAAAERTFAAVDKHIADYKKAIQELAA